MRISCPVLVIAVAFASVTISGIAKESSLPHLVQRDGRYALFVDDAPFLILGAQVNNSSGWPERCRRSGRR